ncbi:MAG: HAMP domain-containing sensor histidine kinase, partial [Coprothermobacterota bacterium]|nr:HAMP domain-containing sensor histidine kinase [Coprothermobacterota bacterium]
IRRIVPLEESEIYLNQKANEVILDSSDVSLWVPVYKNNALEGFILGIINIDELISPIIGDISNVYMLQISNGEIAVFTSNNWKPSNEGLAVNQMITLQNTAVLNLSLAPTDEDINLETTNSLKFLLFSLLFSAMTILAIYFAQKFSILSRLNESRYRELLEDARLVAVILDISGRVTFCNDYLLALSGWKREELIGQDWFARFVPSDWELEKETFLAALPFGKIAAHSENPILTRTGERRRVMFNNTILRDTRGNIIGLASLGEDITERKQLEQAVEKARADFLFAVSHELKTPLLVMGVSQEMIESLPEEQRLAKFREYGDIWRRNLLRLRFIIDNLVDSQRPAGMGLKLEKLPTNLMDLAREIAEELEPLASARSVQLRFQGEPLPPALMDRNAIRRLLENLLTNAIKFSHPGEEVEIRSRTEGEMACLEVCDFGMGIDPQIKPFLFQPFYRSPEALKAGVQGTGLGLYVSKMIVEAHGGSIQLESEPGKGAIFVVRLPMREADSSSIPDSGVTAI